MSFRHAVIIQGAVNGGYLAACGLLLLAGYSTWTGPCVGTGRTWEDTPQVDLVRGRWLSETLAIILAFTSSRGCL